jgi:lipopolysaccharide export LptBFGC system permease protein LptF
VQSQGKVVTQHVIQLHQRLALPLAAVVVALVVCGHIIHPRSQGVLVGLGGGLGWVLAYYGVFLLFQNLGDRGLLPAAVAVWFANVVFAIFGVAILLRGSRA